MKIRPIITSLLDNDLYTFTVGQVAFKYFRGAKVQYQFINRGKTRFPTGFVAELKEQLELMKELRLTDEELAYLTKLGHFTQEYLDFIKAFRFDQIPKVFFKFKFFTALSTNFNVIFKIFTFLRGEKLSVKVKI